MALFGKILTVLNVLAALAFFYVAGIDWGKRQSWAYAVYRHELAIEGLPLDDEDRDIGETAPKVERLSDATAKQIFQSVGAEPVKTQQKEIEELHAKLVAEIDGLKDEKAKRDKLRDYLMPLKTTAVERDAIAAQCADEKKSSPSSLLDLLKKEFDKATSEKDPANRRAPSEKRAAMAHLLFNIKPDDVWHKRVVVVIGLRAYAAEANRQADALNEMAHIMLAKMKRDMHAFASRHDRTATTIKERTALIAVAETNLADARKLEAEHARIVKDLKNRVEREKKAIVEAGNGARKALADLADEQAKLFRFQREAGETLARNRELLLEISKLESQVSLEKRP